MGGFMRDFTLTFQWIPKDSDGQRFLLRWPFPIFVLPESLGYPSPKLRRASLGFRGFASEFGLELKRAGAEPRLGMKAGSQAANDALPSNARCSGGVLSFILHRPSSILGFRLAFFCFKDLLQRAVPEAGALDPATWQPAGWC